jgi:serine protease Do
VITDSVLIGGDSGGPLFNLAGELVGIHSSIGDIIAENRHVSMGTFRKDWTRLLSGERWGKLPELGDDESSRKPRRSANRQSDATDSPSVSAASLGLTVQSDGGKLLVAEVQPGSPAARVGLKPGDEMLSLDGSQLATIADFESAAGRLKAGGSAAIAFRRNGATLQLNVILQKF